jgi:O-antigen ligase
MSPERDVGDALRIYSNSGDGIRFASMFSDANFWGYFQLYITLIGFYVYKFTKKNIFGVLTLLSILGILISASRSALIGLIIAIFIFLIYIKQLKRYLIYFLISLILLSVINTISLENNVATSLSRFSNESSVGDEGVRIALMLNGINKFIHNPLFGAGIGNLIVKGRIDMVSSAHNIYLSILGEMGLFGFIPFIIFIYLIAISLIRIIRRSKSIKIKYLSSIYLSLLVAIVFISLLYDFLWALECNAVLLGLMINFIYLNLSKYKKTHYIENQTNKSENMV